MFIHSLVSYFLFQGVLLIAVRRPFDLGDRIVITKADDIDSPGTGASWFVEGNVLIRIKFSRTSFFISFASLFRRHITVLYDIALCENERAVHGE